MKTIIAFLIITCIYSFANAQSYAVINDKDGFVNVRKEKSANSAIVGKIYDDNIFVYDYEDHSDWIKIYRQKPKTNGEYAIEGYIHKSRLFPLSKFKSIKTVKNYKDSCVIFNDSLKVVIESKHFNPKNHKLLYSKANPKDNTSKELIKIDGKDIWGTDGEIPKVKITSVKVIKHGVPVVIPKDAFGDL
jgi:hypothetical protein